MKKLLLLLSAISMVAAFTVSAMASTWDFYGSARFQTLYVSIDNGTDAENAEDSGSVWGVIPTTSRIGASVKVNDEISGRFEIRPANGANQLRLLYGTVKLTPTVSLVIGQDWTPINYFECGGAIYDDGGLSGFGALSTNRDQQIRFDISLDEGMLLNVALINPGTDAAISNIAIGGEIDPLLPKIEINFGIGLSDIIKLNICLGYSSITSDAAKDSDDDYTVDSWILGLNTGLNLGNASVNASIWFAQNADNYDSNLTGNPLAVTIDGTSVSLATNSRAQLEDDEVTNASTFGIIIVPGLKISETLSMVLSFAYVSATPGVDDAKAATQLSLAATAVVTLAEGVTVVPEVGYSSISSDEDGADDDCSIYWLGAKWQIDF